MYKEYAFYLTDAQMCAIHDVGVADVEVSFTTSGMVNATVFEDYSIICYTFRKDGEIMKESRTFAVSDGWVTDTRDSDGVWSYESEVN